MQRIMLPALALAVAVMATQANISNASKPQDDGAGWHLLYEGPMAKLVYGVADSDQVALMLTCTPGDHRLALFGDVEPDTPRLQPASLGPTAIDPLSQGTAWEMHLAMDDEVLAGLAHQGVMPVRSEGEVLTLTANRAEQKMVRDFLGYCAVRHA